MNLLVLLLLKEVGCLEISRHVPIKIVDKKTICNLSINNNCENHQGLTHYEYIYDSETGKFNLKNREISILHRNQTASKLFQDQNL